VSSTLTDVAEAFNLNDAGEMVGMGPQARRRRGVSPQRKAAHEAAFRLLTAAWDGDRRASLTATEAFSTSDLFRSAAGDILDRVLLAQYDATPTQWQTFATRTTVRNFRKKYLYELMGSRTVLERVPELTEYPSADYTLAERSISVAKFGRRFGWSWEAGINDDIGELEQVPGQFAIAARKTEDFEVLKQAANPVTGAPNTAFFNATNGNLGTGALTYDNLTTVLSNRLATRRDAEGNLLARPAMRLVVGPGVGVSGAAGPEREHHPHEHRGRADRRAERAPRVRELAGERVPARYGLVPDPRPRVTAAGVLHRVPHRVGDT
jgi:hypothetical protein